MPVKSADWFVSRTTAIQTNIYSSVCIFLSQVQSVNLTLTSVIPLPVRTEPLALTSLVITSANAWLHLKVIHPEGTGTKAKLINFPCFYFPPAEPGSHVVLKVVYVRICSQCLNS